MTQMFISWRGPGNGYDLPDSSDPRTTANQLSRYGMMGLRQGIGSRAVMAASARNAGDIRVDEIATRGGGSFVTYNKPGSSGQTA